MPNERFPRSRSQSAMEYLMTYGWAILIIAVVLGALYSLGVFNTASLQPKVPGGGCHVFRPNGPGTSWNVNLVGSCNNALPQYVAQFNGQNGYVDVPNKATFNPTASITISVWANPTSVSPSYQGIIDAGYWWNTDTGYELRFYSPGRVAFYVANGITYDGLSSTGQIAAGVWVNVVGTWQPGTNNLNIYVNGVQTSKTNAFTSLAPSSSDLWIGRSAVNPNYFGGSIANVQIYNTSLTANQVKYLYNEGIGGVPISPQYLVGWWPLNGDVADYSGNGNNGVPTNVIYNGSWTSGYYR